MDVAAALKRRLPHTKLIFDFHEFFLHRLRLTDTKRRTLRHYVDHREPGAGVGRRRW